MKAVLSNLPSISRSVLCCPLTALQERNSWADHEPKESFFSLALSNDASIYANRFYYVGPGSRVSTEKTARSQKERGPGKSCVIREHLKRVDPSKLSWPSKTEDVEPPDRSCAVTPSGSSSSTRICTNFKHLTVLWTLCIKWPSIYLGVSRCTPHLGGYLLPECPPTWMSGVKPLDADAAQARVILLSQ